MAKKSAVAPCTTSTGPDVKPTAGDIAIAVTKGMLGMVPYAGGIAAEMVSLFVTTPLDRRRTEWLMSLADSLDRLRRGEGVDWEALKNNESFVSILFHATQIAVRSHQKEKLEALRNAVLNSAREGTPDDDLRLMFLNFVDTFTPWHLRVLAFLRNPKSWMDSNAVRYQNITMGGISTVLDLTFPELAKRSDFRDQVVKDLYVKGLLSTESIHTTMTADGMVATRTTELGKRLLEFVSEPAASAVPSRP